MKRSGYIITISLIALTVVTAIGIVDYRNHHQLATPKLEKIRQFQGVSEYRLSSNGLTVLFLAEPHSTSTTVNMTYKAGSADEQVGQAGIAHLLEHMIFRDTEKFKDALAAFSTHGLSANGTTTENGTNYYATFPSSHETLEWYLNWQADAMTHASLSPETLAKEKTIVRNELEQKETSHRSRLLKQIRRAAYQKHPYGHTPIGERSDLQHMSSEDLRNFYQTHYQPDNAVLIIAGSFDLDDTIHKIESIFGVIPRRTTQVLPPPEPEAIQEGERRVTIRRPGGSPLVIASYHAPAGADPDMTALLLATDILGHNSFGRLTYEIVDQGPAISAYSDTRFMKDTSTVSFLADISSGTSPYEVLEMLHSTIESVAENPFTEQELTHAKRPWLNEWTQLQADTHQLAIALSDMIALGDWRILFQHMDLLEKMPLQKVQQAAERYFIASNRTEGLHIPTANPLRLPPAKTIDLEKQLNSYSDEPYESLELAQTSDSFEPSFEYVQAHTEIKTIEHKNGTVKIALLPKPSSGQRVRAAIRLQFGDAESLRGKREIAAAAVDMLSGGNAETPYQVIENKFAALKTQHKIGGGLSSVDFLLKSHHDTLDAALHLAFHVLKTPDYQELHLNDWVTRTIASVSNTMEEPDSIAFSALHQHCNVSDKSSVHYPPSFQETIENTKNIAIDDVIKFHKDFYGANSVLVVLVGDFETDTAVEAITEELESWQPGKPFTPIVHKHQPIKPITITHRTPGQSNATMLTATTFALQTDDPDYPALVVANHILGSSHDSLLWQRIRHKEGLTYNINSSLDVEARNDEAVWGIHTNYAPENKDQIEKLIFEEIHQALKDGFNQAELDAAKEHFMQSEKLWLANDGEITSLWMNSLIDGMDNLNFHMTLAKKIQALTLQDVNQSFRKYLQPNQMVRIFVGDFAQDKPSSPKQKKTKASYQSK